MSLLKLGAWWQTAAVGSSSVEPQSSRERSDSEYPPDSRGSQAFWGCCRQMSVMPLSLWLGRGALVESSANWPGQQMAHGSRPPAVCATSPRSAATAGLRVCWAACLALAHGERCTPAGSSARELLCDAAHGCPSAALDSRAGARTQHHFQHGIIASIRNFTPPALCHRSARTPAPLPPPKSRSRKSPQTRRHVRLSIVQHGILAPILHTVKAPDAPHRSDSVACHD